MVMVDVDVDGSCQLSVDSQPKSTGLVWGWWPPGVVIIIIIIIIIIINSHRIIIKSCTICMIRYCIYVLSKADYCSRAWLAH